MDALIVDDNATYLKFLRTEVNWDKIPVDDVYTADSVRSAEEILKNTGIRLLITDIEMPGESGLSLIEWCRQNHLSCAVIILSNYPNFSYAQKAISLGADAYMLKTADHETIEKTILHTLKRIRPAQETEDEPVPLRKIRDYVQNHIAEAISRADLADYVGFTPEYLSFYFRKETDGTLKHYIISEKIRYAQKLLRQTDLSISEIAQNLSFETSSYFAALFRKMTGQTPREYRKQEARQDI